MITKPDLNRESDHFLFRRHFRYTVPELAQLILGLSIPLLLIGHFSIVRLAGPMFDRPPPNYASILNVYWNVRTYNITGRQQHLSNSKGRRVGSRGQDDGRPKLSGANKRSRAQGAHGGPDAAFPDSQLHLVSESGHVITTEDAFLSGEC